MGATLYHFYLSPLSAMECPASLMAKSYFIQNGNFVCTRNKVGEGAYGVVYSGRYRDKQCALKYIRSYLLQSASARVFSMDQFERECEMTHRLSSPYIVRFLGVSFHRNVPVLLAELLECSLTDVLGCQHCSVPYHREIDIALGIARGIHFLHCQTPPVVHRDLSSNNVLMASDYRVKIADLGVAKSMDNRFCSTMPGTLPYMPPEVHQPTELSVAIDLFSFAVLMVQLETRKSPNPGDQMERVPSQEGDEGDGESRRGVAIPQCTVEGDSGQYRVRPECERRRDHIELMDPSGVLHRIVHCYLVDEPRGRRRTPLTEVTRWLEQETQTPRYTDSVKENPEV